MKESRYGDTSAEFRSLEREAAQVETDTPRTPLSVAQSLIRLGEVRALLDTPFEGTRGFQGELVELSEAMLVEETFLAAEKTKLVVNGISRESHAYVRWLKDSIVKGKNTQLSRLSEEERVVRGRQRSHSIGAHLASGIQNTIAVSNGNAAYWEGRTAQLYSDSHEEVRTAVAQTLQHLHKAASISGGEASRDSAPLAFVEVRDIEEIISRADVESKYRLLALAQVWAAHWSAAHAGFSDSLTAELNRMRSHGFPH